MNPATRRARVAIALVFLIALTACSLSQIVQTINTAVQIAESAAAVTGVNIPPEYLAYVSAAANCIAFAATEQVSSDSSLVEATQITAKCSEFAKVALPPGTAQKYVDAAGKLAVSIQAILAQLPKPIKPRAKGAAAQPEADDQPLTDRDVKVLKHLAKRAASVHAKTAK